LIVNGYAKEVLNQLPMEFAVEAQKLLALTLEGKCGVRISDFKFKISNYPNQELREQNISTRIKNKDQL
jgi:hypothetical protein